MGRHSSAWSAAQSDSILDAVESGDHTTVSVCVAVDGGGVAGLRTMLVKVLVAGWGERRWRCVASPGLASNGLSPLALFLQRSTEELKAMHAPRWRAPPEILPKPQLAEAFRCIDTPFSPSGATAVAGSDQKLVRHNNHSPKPKNETIFRVARLSPRSQRDACWTLFSAAQDPDVAARRPGRGLARPQHFLGPPHEDAAHGRRGLARPGSLRDRSPRRAGVHRPRAGGKRGMKE